MIRKGIFIVLQCPVEWKHLKTKNPGSSLRRGGRVKALRTPPTLRYGPAGETPPLRCGSGGW